MIAVIFIVEAKTGKIADYLALAQQLNQELRQLTGLISVERFQSVQDPQRMLSLSFWQDREAIEQWRQHEQHRKAQEKGKNDLFQCYNIHIAEVFRHYSFPSR